MELKKITPLTTDYMDSIGFSWHTDTDHTLYIADELVKVNSKQANDYYNAANELYDMYINAAQYVIDNNLFHEIGIPFNLIEIIKSSWENDVHWHIYGRFDFAGGLDGRPIKLIEFNADTPTSLFETAILQWAILKQNNMDETMQFNDLFEALRLNFRRLVTLNDNTDSFDELYDGWKILFSTIAGSTEDDQTTQLLKFIASEAGFNTEFAHIDQVSFSDEEGIFFENENYEFLFKLIPWEQIAIDEGELALILTNIIKNKKAIILNPAYTLLFQSKGILKILWKLYPNHPLLLETDDKILHGKKCVKKPIFGREGANVSIIDENSEVIIKNDGDYENMPSIYQEYYALDKDDQGRSYQAGVFFAYEACGLGYRRGTEIINNTSKFVGHYIGD